MYHLKQHNHENEPFFIAIGLLICLLATPATLNAADAGAKPETTTVTSVMGTFYITVEDESGEPIVGASVAAKKGSFIAGTVTDVDGRACLTVNQERFILVISFVGYKPVEMEIRKGVNNLTIRMQPDISNLE